MMNTPHFHLQPQYKYELFHIYFTRTNIQHIFAPNGDYCLYISHRHSTIVSLVIASRPKFSLSIGFPRAYLSRKRLAITWCQLGLVHTSDGSGVGSAKSVMIQCNQTSEAESEARRNRSQKDQKSFFFFLFRFRFRRFRSSENRVNGIGNGILSLSKRSFQVPFEVRARKSPAVQGQQKKLSMGGCR